MASESGAVIRIQFFSSASGPYVQVDGIKDYAVPTPCVVVDAPGMQPVIFGADAALEMLDTLRDLEPQLREALAQEMSDDGE